MAIKIGKSAIGTWVKTGRTTVRRVVDYLPPDTLQGATRRWSDWFSRPVKTGSYILDTPSSYQRVTSKKFLALAKDRQESREFELER